MEKSHLIRLLSGILTLLLLTLVMGGYVLYQLQSPDFLTLVHNKMNDKSIDTAMQVATTTPKPVRIENGIDVETGFIAKGDFEIVRTTCTACHSAKLVLQNRATREGWKQMIVWMQETQKLWDLGTDEERILDYLTTYYGPINKGRRANIEVTEWYELQP